MTYEPQITNKETGEELTLAPRNYRDRIRQAETAIAAARVLLHHHRGTSDELPGTRDVLPLLDAYTDQWCVAEASSR